jgi:hypothetical protein
MTFQQPAPVADIISSTILMLMGWIFTWWFLKDTKFPTGIIVWCVIWSLICLYGVISSIVEIIEQKRIK